MKFKDIKSSEIGIGKKTFIIGKFKTLLEMGGSYIPRQVEGGILGGLVAGGIFLNNFEPLIIASILTVVVRLVIGIIVTYVVEFVRAENEINIRLLNPYLDKILKDIKADLRKIKEQLDGTREGDKGR